MFPAMAAMGGGGGMPDMSSSATSGSNGGNNTVNVGGFNVGAPPEWPGQFGLSSKTVQGGNANLLIGVAAVALVAIVLSRKK